jgi:ubiquinone/menaquinone biosynthesis C-methylase UbiE
MKYEKVVEHYREQASKHGLDAVSTMPDRIVRQKEVYALCAFVTKLYCLVHYRPFRVLDVCCGNGYLLERMSRCLPPIEQRMSRCLPPIELNGIELVPEMAAIAKSRNCAKIVEGNILNMPYPDDYFDAVVSERGIINILDEDKQIEAYREIARVTAHGGECALIEGFKDGLENLNKARAEFMLPPIEEPYFNNWYTEERWQKFLEQGFKEIEHPDLPPRNFLSSHYFMTRFVHDVIRPEGGALRNTEFAAFFSEALPPVGDYSPVQIRYLKKE